MNRLKQEKQVLEEMIEWLERRINELGGMRTAYDFMKKDLEDELESLESIKSGQKSK
jgi:archaellum component FlaC